MKPTTLEEAETIVRLAQAYESSIRIRDELRSPIIQADRKDGKIDVLGVMVDAREFESTLWISADTRKDELIKAIKKLSSP